MIGVMHGFGAIVRGSQSLAIPEVSPDSFLANLIDLGDRLSKEFIKEDNAVNMFT